MNYYLTFFLTSLLLQSLYAAENSPCHKRKLETSEEFFLPIKKQKKESLFVRAINAKNPELLEQAISSSDNLNEEIEYKATPLVYATEQDDLVAVQCLVQKGADINYAIDGYYPLQTAVMLNRNEIAHYLLDLKADPNIETHIGLPLTWAIEHKNSQLAERLIEQGADLKGDGEKCPNYLSHARKKNKNGSLNNVIKLLKEKHAPMSLWDTLLMLAHQNEKNK